MGGSVHGGEDGESKMGTERWGGSRRDYIHSETSTRMEDGVGSRLLW